jgi:hypothetical protein
MRIAPESAAGQRLLAWGVTERELRAARLFRWDLQKGGAVTLPVFFGRSLIFAKSRYVARDERGELEDGPRLTKIRHEL